MLTAIGPTVVNFQTVTCGTVLGPRSRFAYATNNVSNTITGYRVGFDGSLELLDPDGVTALSNTRPVGHGRDGEWPLPVQPERRHRHRGGLSDRRSQWRTDPAR